MILSSVTSHLAAKGTDWAGVAAWAAMAQVVVLVAAGFFARNQLRESQLARRSEFRPYVIIYAQTMESRRWALELVIENVGTRPARNVTFNFTPELTSTFQLSHPNDPMVWSALSNGVAFIAPGQKLVHLFDSTIDRYAEACELPDLYDVSVSYKDPVRTTEDDYKETYSLDFGIWRGSMYSSTQTIDDISKAIQTLSNEVKKWTEDGGVRVYTEDLKDHRESKQEMMRQRMRRADSEGESSE